MRLLSENSVASHLLSVARQLLLNNVGKRLDQGGRSATSIGKSETSTGKSATSTGKSTTSTEIEIKIR